MKTLIISLTISLIVLAVMLSIKPEAAEKSGSLLQEVKTVKQLQNEQALEMLYKY
jgi:hypothetical protein